MGKAPRLERPPRIEVAPRRGLRRSEAARYIGIGPTKFDGLVREGVMPKPWRIDGLRNSAAGVTRVADALTEFKRANRRAPRRMA